MSYIPSFAPTCERQIEKACKKNSILRKILNKKINEIIANPHHYKPLGYDLAGERRVHIMKNQILKFRVDKQNNRVIFIFFGHHDEAYGR